MMSARNHLINIHVNSLPCDRKIVIAVKAGDLGAQKIYTATREFFWNIYNEHLSSFSSDFNPALF